MDLQDQRVAIIGGTSGIGLATARLAATAGASVVVAGRRSARVDDAVAQLGVAAEGAVVDATSADDLVAFFGRVGPLDHLVLAQSGGEGSGAFRTLDLAALRQAFDAKFWSQVMAARLGLPALRPDGSLTFVTAISARAALPDTAGLAAINGALEAMVAPLALELRPLRVNAVSPGVVATPYWDRLSAVQRAALFDQSARTALVGRVGQPEDIAQAIILLLANGFMTGSVLACDGGLRLASPPGIPDDRDSRETTR